MNCIIIAGGEPYFTPEIIQRIKDADLVICADGGAGHLIRAGFVPHVLMGDFDSINDADKKYCVDHHTDIHTFPEKKDKSDSELCLSFAVQKGATDITFLGATGTRLDHTLANIFLLEQLAGLDIDARILDRTNEIHLVTRSLTLEGSPGEYLSLIPLSRKVEGVTLKGLEYPLSNARIQRGTTLGISNRFKDKTACVSIQGGMLIVTKSKDNEG